MRNKLILESKEKSIKRRIKDLEKIKDSINDERVKELIKYEIMRKRIDLCSSYGTVEYRGHEIMNENNDDENIKCDICKTSVKDLIDLDEEFRRNKEYVIYNNLGEDLEEYED